MSDRVDTDVERFAASHFPLVVHVARLLTGDRAVAEDLAIEGMREVQADRERTHDDAQRLQAALSVVGRRVLRRDQRSWVPVAGGGLELYDIRPTDEPVRPAVTDPQSAVRDALRALTDRERTATVLYLVGEMDPRDIAHALRRPSRVVRRDIDQSVAFLESAIVGVSAVEGAELVRRALRPSVGDRSDSGALVERLVASVEADPPKLAHTRSTLVAMAAVAALIIAVGTVAFDRAEDDGQAASAEKTEPPTGADEPSRLHLPKTPSGLKLVGFRGIMLVVPDTWRQLAGGCHQLHGDVVLYPGVQRRVPCAGDLSSGSTVSFGYVNVTRRSSFDRTVAERSTSPVLVTTMLRRGTDFVQRALLLEANVSLIVRSPNRREVAAVISSFSGIPPGYVVVPRCLDLDPDEALSALAGVALSGQIYTDSAGAAGLPVHVVSQSPSVGTIVPTGSKVKIAVLPR